MNVVQVETVTEGEFTSVFLDKFWTSFDSETGGKFFLMSRIFSASPPFS